MQSGALKLGMAVKGWEVSLFGAGIAGLIGAGLGYFLSKRGHGMTKMEKAALALIGLLCEKVIALEEECEKLRARPTQEDYTRLVKENGELRSKLDARLVVTPSSAQDDFDPSAPRASGRRKQRRANV